MTFPELRFLFSNVYYIFLIILYCIFREDAEFNNISNYLLKIDYGNYLTTRLWQYFLNNIQLIKLESMFFLFLYQKCMEQNDYWLYKYVCCIEWSHIVIIEIYNNNMVIFKNYLNKVLCYSLHPCRMASANFLYKSACVINSLFKCYLRWNFITL